MTIGGCIAEIDLLQGTIYVNIIVIKKTYITMQHRIGSYPESLRRSISNRGEFIE